METLVLVPGTLCNSVLWSHQVKHISKQTEVVVADITRDDSVEKMAKRLLDDAPDRFSLAGLSQGGMVAMEVIRQAPERVTRLALLDTNHRLPQPHQKEKWDEQIERVKNGEFSEVVEKEFLPALLHESNKKDEALLKELREMFETVGEEGFINQLKANKNRPEGRRAFRYITCPTLILAGREDRLCPEVIQTEMAESVPSAKLIFIENCGHLSPMEQPEAVTAVLQYWLLD